MSKRIFTKEQIEMLSKNNNVSDCSEKYIIYSSNFKKSAIKLYEQGLTSSEIFIQAGFDLDIIGRDTPKDCMRRWRKIYKRKGYDGLSNDKHKNKGRPKRKNMTDKERMEWMEAEIEYLKAENDFLAKLRGLKRE